MIVVYPGGVTAVFNDPLTFARGYLDIIYYFRTDCVIFLSDNVLNVIQADIDLTIQITFDPDKFAAGTGAYTLDRFVIAGDAFSTSDHTPRFLSVFFQLGDAPTTNQVALRMAHLTPTLTGVTRHFPSMPDSYWLPR